jgi:glycosyltransferase involved in cell wall biosynthesis
MRIALIGNDYYPQFPLRGYGGIESSVETLAWGLHRAGHEFVCVVPSGDDAAVLPDRAPGYPFHVVRTRARATVFTRGTSEPFISEALDVLRAERPDAIWSQSCWSAHPLSTLGVPVIVTIQDSGPGDPDRLLEHPAIAYRFVSHFQYRHWVREDRHRSRAFMAHTSLGDEEYDFHPEGGDAYVWVGGLGWGFQGKGLDTFLDLARRNPQEQFVAWASGRLTQRLRAYWASLKVKNFRFMGELLRGPAHRAAFGNARALIMPTRLMEALGRTVLESLSKGTPVIGSAKGALPELIDGTNGVATNDPGAMNEALHTPFDRRHCYASAERFHVRFEVTRLMQVTDDLVQGRFHGAS